MSFWQRKWTAEYIENRFRLEIKPIDTESRSLRREEIILCRLRSDATMITHMIPRIEKRYPHICEECNERLTVNHILVDCIIYAQERRLMVEYFRNINKRLTAYNLLQDDPDIIEILLTYLKSTGLFTLI